MNYEKLGFKCGIEIHQQLETETKLFCNCPIDLKDENPDRNIERFLHSVAGETGKQDKAAKVEAEKTRKFVYNYHHRNNCLVEIDEEPPHNLDKEALDVALQFSQYLDAEIPREIQIMRKIVVDGSNTSGFQRTSMVALNGQLETSQGTVNIEDIELEEESAGINSRNEKKAVYDLSRLGVPLIEIGTDASIKNPEHAKEVAEKLGMLLRSTGKARRGIGTIRQDVNVSIAEGSRVEIKGFQDIKNIDELIRKEVKRQKNLVELAENLQKPSKIQIEEVTGLIEGTENHIISTVLENNGAVYAIKLPQLTGLMKQKISGERYLAKELVDYAKNRGVQGILHTDENIENYQLVDEFQEISKEMNKQDEDVIGIIAAEKTKAKRAIEAVKERAKKIYSGEIPEETRGAEQDQTTSYLRPLPGSARMYPETDIPPVKVTEEHIEEIRKELPKTLEEKEEEYKKEIGEELALQITYSENLALFEEFKEITDPKIVANTFTNILPKLNDQGSDTNELEPEIFEKIFQELEEGDLEKSDIENVLKQVLETSENVEDIIERIIENKTGEEEIRDTIEEILDEKQDLIEEQGMQAQGPLMGIVMQRVEAGGQTVSKILREELENRV